MKKIVWAVMLGVIIIASNLFAADGDLIVEGNVGIGTTTPGAKLDVSGTNEDGLKITATKTGATDVTGALISLTESSTSGTGGARALDASITHTGSTVTNRTAGWYALDLYGSGTTQADYGFVSQWANMLFDPSTAGYNYTNGYAGALFATLATNGNNGPNKAFFKDVAGMRIRYNFDNGNKVLSATNFSGVVIDGIAEYGSSGLDVITNVAGLRVNKQNYGTNRMGIWLNGDGVGADLVLGSNKETKLYGNAGNLIIDTSGKVGIGTTDPQGYKLYVAGSIYASGGYYPSDERFKKDITAIDSPLNKILNIKGVSYSWKTEEYKDKGFSDGRHYGVIGQEIEKVLPDIVKENPNGEKSVAYTEMIPVLIEAMKEQQKTIENQKKEMEELKVKVQRLETKDFVAKAQ
jgi:hypothetical protein